MAPGAVGDGRLGWLGIRGLSAFSPGSRYGVGLPCLPEDVLDGVYDCLGVFVVEVPGVYPGLVIDDLAFPL